MAKDMPHPGEKFGKLTVMMEGRPYIVPTTGRHQTMAIVQCECGRQAAILVHYRDLKNGHSTQCELCRIDLMRERRELMIGDKNPTWKGGRYIDAGGYVRVRSPGNPRTHTNGYMLEHILVMENLLGRYVGLDETVHHKNGIKDDNRPENLELRSGKHGKGAKVEDIIEYCIEMLKLYAPEKLKENILDE